MEPRAEDAGSWRVVGPSWSAVRAAFVGMKPLFLSAALATLLLTIISFYGPALFATGHSRAAAAGIAFALVMAVMILRLLILAPVAVAVHRFILLGENTGGVISIRPSYTRRFALWLILITLVAMVFVLIAAALGLNSFVGSTGKLLFIVSMVALFAGMVFTVLIFPAIAVDEPSAGLKDRLSASLRRMDGHFWLFIGVSIAAALPVVLVGAALGVAVGIIDVAVFHDASHRNPLDFGVEVLADQGQILLAMLGAAVASRFYARFRDQTIPPPARA